MMTFLIFVVALSILVFVHEWGHFIVAKLCGIRVDIFSIGFGPKILGFTWHGTEYRIAPFPFGGYVKIYGQEPMEEAEGDPIKAKEIAEHPDSFASKNFWQKQAVVFAGPVMNLVLCFVLLPLVFMVGRLQPKILSQPPVVQQITAESPATKVDLQEGDLVTALNDNAVSDWKDLVTHITLHPNEEVVLHVKRGSENISVPVLLSQRQEIKQAAGYLGIEPMDFFANDPVIAEVKSGSPADLAGIKPDDRIVAVNGKAIQYWSQVTRMIREGEGSAVSFTIQRQDDQVQVTVKPEFVEQAGTYLVGITKKMEEDALENKSYALIESIQLGAQEFGKLMTLTVDIFSRLFTGQMSLKVLGGPLQIAQATSSAARSGLGDFIYLLSFLSLQLGLVNLFPIPVLDGGHVVFLTIEAIRRRPLPYKFRLVSMQVGMVMLLGLMLLVTINDIETLFGFRAIVNNVIQFF
ncbi:MAG: RIP metalloprotease RseP [Deltaproteobacteria bacterium]|nr:RIP metalloprotease RseP [Deltaproteobacteria bacterium]